MHELTGTLARPDGTTAPGRIVFAEKILTVESAPASGDYILPGFIDLQVNGAFGIDVPASSPAELCQLSRQLARQGTTAYLPTAITAALPNLAHTEHTVAQARELIENDESAAAILGLHLEGPFISPHRLGVHPEATLEPRGAALEQVWRFAQLRLVTLAPELPGALEAIRCLRARGVAVSMGHSDASLDQAQAAIEAGAAMFTHLFNAMRPFHQREPGIIGAALRPSPALAAVIPDGVHVHPENLRLLYRARSAAGIVLTSDSVAAAGINRSLRAAHDRNGRLAGSLISMLDGLVMMVKTVGVPIGEAALMAAANPAAVLGLTDRGRLIAGSRADIVVLDGELRLKAVFLNGREISLIGS